MKNVAIQLTMT